MKEWTDICDQLSVELDCRPRRPEANHLLNTHQPATHAYFSPLNPIFLCEVLDQKWLESSPTWMVRDGLLPTLFFFGYHPSPMRTKSRILIHRSLSDIVPVRWRKLVGLYEMKTQQKRISSVETLLLTGMMAQSYCSLAELERKLKNILNRIDKQSLKRVQILAYLPVAVHSSFDANEKHFEAEYVLQLVRHLGPDIKFLSWNQFKALPSFSKVGIIELNDGNLILDNYMLHYALARGAAIIDLGNSKTQKNLYKNDKNYVPLSPYHGITYALDLPKRTNSKLLSYYCRVNEINEANRINSFSWDRCLKPWVR